MSSSEKINREIEQRAKEYREQKNDPLKPLRDLRAGAEQKNIDAALRLFAESCRGKDDLEVAGLRAEAIKELEQIKSKSPASLIDASLKLIKRTEEKNLQGQDIVFQQPLPWEEAVDGSELLDEVAGFVRRFVVFREHEKTAVSLWIFYAWMFDAVSCSPILFLSSPEKRCGKTLLLEIIGSLAPKPIHTSNITPAALFRTVEKFQPTLLVDEVDSFLRQSDELRGIINSGHRRGSAFTVRVCGDDYEPRMFLTWCPKVFAGINGLPDTVEDRSIKINMRRKKPDEKTERFRLEKEAPKIEELCRKLLRFANDNKERLAQADPEIPEALNDRQADCWRPLIAIADLAGGEWPRKAREAAVALSGEAEQEENSSKGVQLLRDLQAFFSNNPEGKAFSEDILNHLNGMDEAPWSEFRHGKPLTARQLAVILKQFGIESAQIRIGAVSKKGYTKEMFQDAFQRYLSAFSSETAKQINADAGLSDFSETKQRGSVSDPKNEENTYKHRSVSDVSDKNPESVPVGGYEEDDWASIYGEAGVMDL